MEPEVNLVKDDTKKTKKVFETKCYHCKEKEKLTTDDGLSFDLPFAYVEVKKNKDLLKECKAYVKESEEKYKNAKVIKRALINGCPNCGHTINVCCKDYVDFYSVNKNK